MGDSVPYSVSDAHRTYAGAYQASDEFAKLANLGAHRAANRAYTGAHDAYAGADADADAGAHTYF